MSDLKLPDGVDDVASITKHYKNSPIVRSIVEYQIFQRDSQWAAVFARAEAELKNLRDAVNNNADDCNDECTSKGHRDGCKTHNTSAMLIELQGKLAQVEVERDEAIAREQIRRDRCDAAEAGMHLQVASAQARIAELREALNELCMSVDDLDSEEAGEGRNLFVSPGCLVCTSGTTPDHRSTGLCAYHRATAALSRPDDGSALKEIVTRAVAEAGMYAANMAERFESKWGVDKPDEHGFADTASAAILTDLCDPDDPDTLRIVARVIGRE